MKKIKKAFSIVELIVATTILVVGVFGVSALLANNQNNLNNSWEYSFKKSLYYSAFECFKSKKNISNLTLGEKYQIDFGNDFKGCNVIKNGNQEVKINGISYSIKAKITEKNSNFAKIEIFIDGGLKIKPEIFVYYKK